MYSELLFLITLAGNFFRLTRHIYRLKNHLKRGMLTPGSCRQGDTPANGLAFEEMCHNVLANTPSSGNKGFKFVVFGNGDSRYSNTYNGAAVKTHSLMKQMGGSSLMRGIWQGDTAAEPLPLHSLSSWWEKLQPSINDDQQEELLSTLKYCTLVVTVPEVGTRGDRSFPHKPERRQ